MRSMRLWPRVSPSPEATSGASRYGSGDEIADVLVELCVMLNRFVVTNVMCYVVRNTVCSILLDESGSPGDAKALKLRPVLITQHLIHEHPQAMKG